MEVIMSALVLLEVRYTLEERSVGGHKLTPVNADVEVLCLQVSAPGWRVIGITDGPTVAGSHPSLPDVRSFIYHVLYTG
jgi:hypothetical protein